MPQASEEDRDRAVRTWGSILGDGPMEFLKSKGWTEDKGFWTPPKAGEISEEEWFAFDFLMDEWDHAMAHDVEDAPL